MDEKKAYNAKIHYEAEKKLKLLYSDKVLLERFNRVKEELIEKYPDKKEAIENLKKVDLIIRIRASI